MKFNTFYFENYNLDLFLDHSNPRFVMSMNGVDEVLSKIITHKPYTFEINDFDQKEIVKHLLHIDVLQCHNNKLGFAIPVFIEKDYQILHDLCFDVSKTISDILLTHKDEINKIISKVSNGYSNERNLYHILGGYIFDGKIFDFLEINNLVTVSKIHSSKLDYLIILYEDCPLLNRYSNTLLCSYNRLSESSGVFSSFGDSNGLRKDFYRYFRLNELNKLKDDQRRYVKFTPKELIDNFNHLIDGNIIESKYLEVYQYFNYCENEKIIVPIYDHQAFQVGDQLFDYILELIKDSLISALSKIKKQTKLTAFSHLVDVSDISNEIYHIIFGEINERLIENEMIEKPLEIKGEGRYLKSFERLI